MLQRLLALLFAMSLLSLLGCGPATELPASLTDLRVEIRVEHLTECKPGSKPYVRHALTATLRDARGRDIERGDVRMEVNGVVMPFRVATGNYYDRHPYYQIADDARIPARPGTEYRFTLVKPDGSRHELGAVTMPASLEPAQFAFNGGARTPEGITLAWRELAEPAELTVFRSDVVRDAEGTRVYESGSANDPAALRRTIGPAWFRRGSDRWSLPDRFLTETPARALSAVGAEVRIAHQGRLTNTVAKQSTLIAERRLTLRIECERPE